MSKHRDELQLLRDMDDYGLTQTLAERRQELDLRSLLSTRSGIRATSLLIHGSSCLNVSSNMWAPSNPSRPIFLAIK